MKISIKITVCVIQKNFMCVNKMNIGKNKLLFFYEMSHEISFLHE